MRQKKVERNQIETERDGGVFFFGLVITVGLKSEMFIWTVEILMIFFLFNMCERTIQLVLRSTTILPLILHLSLFFCFVYYFDQ